MILEFICGDCDWTFDRLVAKPEDLNSNERCPKCGSLSLTYQLVELGCGNCDKAGKCGGGCGSENKSQPADTEIQTD